MNGVAGRHAGLFAHDCEVNHHNSVFLNNAHKHKEANHSVNRELHIEQPQAAETSDDCNRQRRKHRYRVYIAFVKYAEDYVHDENRNANEVHEAHHSLLEGDGFANKLARDSLRESLGGNLRNPLYGVSDGNSGLKVEVYSYGREVVDVVDSHRSENRVRVRDRPERNQAREVKGRVWLRAAPC